MSTRKPFAMVPRLMRTTYETPGGSLRHQNLLRYDPVSHGQFGEVDSGCQFATTLALSIPWIRIHSWFERALRDDSDSTPCDIVDHQRDFCRTVHAEFENARGVNGAWGAKEDFRCRRGDCRNHALHPLAIVGGAMTARRDREVTTVRDRLASGLPALQSVLESSCLADTLPDEPVVCPSRATCDGAGRSSGARIRVREEHLDLVGAGVGRHARLPGDVEPHDVVAVAAEHRHDRDHARFQNVPDGEGRIGNVARDRQRIMTGHTNHQPVVGSPQAIEYAGAVVGQGGMHEWITL